MTIVFNHYVHIIGNMILSTQLNLYILLLSQSNPDLHSIFCYGCAEVVPHFPSVDSNLLRIKN